MKKVGFTGGALVVELGYSRDMLFFFDCLKFVCERQYPERNWILLTERLFKYYVRRNEVDETNELMQEAYDIFSKTSTKSVDFSEIIQDSWASELNISLKTLSDVFSRYFSAFFECYESAKLMYDEFKSYPDYQYEPIRIVLTSMPEHLDDMHRELIQYDALAREDSPFWLDSEGQ
ncbi:hypothetical protein [Advenella mimigardefordensis]|uniref:Uncharacterized protein n=1 Tax=Advenella mimigardefordensis (strain DSM 17166 / LMG 22922 / DPN7) TaxID=1247726 RepID=W0PKQ6_ADVMD|nr:hypothetical protein [Advenella mimigardefordensis]AHG65578.1 hypothetical protein MIM_c35180 [Advenella mimigardefordensis DPN7]